MAILEVKGLSKRFGSHQIVNDIDFTVPEGSIFGFIGVNGAGKTTTMKMILGLLGADSGSIYVNGEKVTYGEAKTNRHIGYLPDVPEFYGYMRPKEYLQLCGEIVGLSKETARSRSTELLALVGLADVNRKISGFSRGMKQRLGMAQALLNEPKLLICDEPTSALDPMGRKEILDILEAIKGKTTVIFSTHILSDVERVCDQIAILDGGKIVLDGMLADIRSKQKAEQMLVEFANEADKERFTSLENQLLQGTWEDLQVLLDVSDMEAGQRQLMKQLVDHDILPTRLEVLTPTLEHLFLEVIG